MAKVYKNDKEFVEAFRQAKTPQGDSTVNKAVASNPVHTYSYTVMINNKPVTKEYKVVGSKADAEIVKESFDKMAQTEKGQRALNQYAQTDSKLVVVIGNKTNHAYPAKDPFNQSAPYNKRADATIIEFNPRNMQGVKVQQTDNVKGAPTSRLLTPYEVFMHEFAHALQLDNKFPSKQYSQVPVNTPKTAREYVISYETMATKWSNDLRNEGPIGVRRGNNGEPAYYFRQNYGGMTVDKRGQIIDRQPENVISYQDLTNKREYLTRDQIHAMNKRLGTNYTIKPDAKGVFVNVDTKNGEYPTRHLFHVSDVEQKGVANPKKPAEVKNDFESQNRTNALAVKDAMNQRQQQNEIAA